MENKKKYLTPYATTAMNERNGRHGGRVNGTVQTNGTTQTETGTIDGNNIVTTRCTENRNGSRNQQWRSQPNFRV